MEEVSSARTPRLAPNRGSLRVQTIKKDFRAFFSHLLRAAVDKDSASKDISSENLNELYKKLIAKTDMLIQDLVKIAAALRHEKAELKKRREQMLTNEASRGDIKKVMLQEVETFRRRIRLQSPSDMEIDL